MTPETLKLTVKAERTMFGKASGQFTARLGEWTATETTREEAVAALNEKLTQAERQAHVRRYLVTSNGVVFSLYYAQGWCYDIIRTGQAGAYSPGSCLMACTSFVDAYAAMKAHWEAMEADCVKAMATA